MKCLTLIFCYQQLKYLLVLSGSKRIAQHWLHMFTIIHRTVRLFIPVEACMEIGQNALKHSSGSEISNWTTFPGKWLSSVLAEIPLLLVQKKKITLSGRTKNRLIHMNCTAYQKNSPDHSFHLC